MKLFEVQKARVNVAIRALGVMMISCVWMLQAVQAVQAEPEIIPLINLNISKMALFAGPFFLLFFLFSHPY